MDFVGIVDSDHEGDLEIRRSLKVGLIKSLVLKVEKPAMLYDRFCIQKSGTKENLKDM